MAETDLASDHLELYDNAVARRYFAKFDRIAPPLARVAAELETEGRLTRAELRILGGYLEGLAHSFRALSLKYLLTGRAEALLPNRLTIDRHESGFPVYQELLLMANDAQHALRNLQGMPSEAELKDRMIRQIVGELSVPTRLQFALSQRLYAEALIQGDLFWAQNDPEILWLREEAGRRIWLLSWAVYDSQINLPVVWLMEVADSGRVALAKDERRWPRVRAHLMAQSLAGLKLLTVATGFDTDFDDLHPLRLRRLHLGPMYSASFTLQSGPIGEVLAEARAPEGQDWALVWTIEDLEASGTTRAKSGWFGSVERQVYALDPFLGRGAETGATRTDRYVILPERPYQVLAERNPPGFRDVRKFVVGAGGRVISAR
ncbi:hypothetical protein [Ruixingdingia sedimenti]|uniref:Uncharacterized protein n=1 Tax=Ruixingdingia sedimenti TaxID=3073604 RepID=A0ABU1F6T2_9RHOB|nr:hypothetical protein [Xinfangfangia sp. LG-4]MDR5652544.1 hypothetical protein [Xinfangfangia sp. LG-4]